MRFFQNEAYLEESHARREAERGTFDPSYVVYSAGKLMLLKLRADWQEQQGGKPSLRAFHDALLAQGSAPFWALRQLMLGAHAEDVLDVGPRCPSTSTECQACGHRFEVIQKFSDAPPAECPKCGGAVEKLVSSPAIQFKGSGFYLTDYGRGGKSDTAPGKGAKSESATRREGARNRPRATRARRRRRPDRPDRPDRPATSTTRRRAATASRRPRHAQVDS